MLGSSGKQTSISQSEASGSISVDSRMAGNVYLSAGFIGASRCSGAYNVETDLKTLSEKVTDSNYNFLKVITETC